METTEMTEKDLEARNRLENNPLGYEKIKTLLFQFAVPSVVSMLVNSLYNIVDQIFIGQGVGYLGNAATTVAFPITTIALAISMLIGAGASAFASIKLGEKKYDVAEKTLGNMFMLSVIIGLIAAIFGVLYLEPMLRLFGATQTVMPLAKDYSRIVLIGSPFVLLGAGLSNMARTDGSPKIAMVGMLIGAGLNTILDPIYIFVFHWGVKGAAIATITSQIISAGILVWYFLKKGKMKLRWKYFIPDFPLIGSFMVLGVSSCITQAASTILQVILNNSLVYYGDLSEVTGDVALSAMGIVMKVSMILVAFDIGIGVGVQPILGFNTGARKPHRIKEAFRLGCSYATIISVAGWLMCLLIPGIILSVFGTENELFRTFSIKCLRIFMAGIFTAGFQIVATSYFQATGQAVKASILSMLRQLILLIPLIIVLPLCFGLDGILYAGPVADLTAGIVVGIFTYFEMKKLNKWINENEALGIMD